MSRSVDRRDFLARSLSLTGVGLLGVSRFSVSRLGVSGLAVSCLGVSGCGAANEQSKFVTRCFQVVVDLSSMLICQFRNGFYFQDDLFETNEVGFVLLF